jgi:hypothetical protein
MARELIPRDEWNRLPVDGRLQRLLGMSLDDCKALLEVEPLDCQPEREDPSHSRRAAYDGQAQLRGSAPGREAGARDQRLMPGISGTAVPLPETKMPKVGVKLAPIVVVTEGPVALMHMPLIGSVWHTARPIGRLAIPVLALAMIVDAAPTLSVATANTPVSVGPAIST